MTTLDREIQRQILEHLESRYPNSIVGLHKKFVNIDELKIYANLRYLDEHGLILANISKSNSSPDGWKNTAGSEITAKGLDFLADDGGLTSILGTITIKLHAETLRDLLHSKIDEASIPIEEKNSLKRKLSSLGGDALKELTKEMVKKGIEYTPDAMLWIETLIKTFSK